MPAAATGWFVTIQGDKRVAAKFNAMRYAALNTRPAMELVAARLMQIEEDIFDTEGLHSGKRWSPISDEWWDRKYHSGLDTRILHATRALRDSMSIPEARDQILIIGNRTVTLGSDLEYAGKQNRQRPFNKLTKLDRTSLREIIREYLMGAFRAGGTSAE